VGFSQFTSNSNENVFDGISAEMGLLLRKLTKKDQTTKLKAAEELNAVLDTEDQAMALLPFWPKVYSKSSIDPERRMRLLINNAHEKMVMLLRKQIAPYLNDIMGYWVLSMFDPVADVARVATAAFQVSLYQYSYDHFN
jgi:hypothetical protein